MTNRKRLADVGEIEQALRFIPAHDRDMWVAIGMAIKAELGDSGFDIWDHWSQTADNYRERDARDVWRSFRGGGIGIGTLFYYARQHGWNPPHRAGYVHAEAGIP